MDLVAVNKFMGFYCSGFNYISNCPVTVNGKGRILLLWNDNCVNVTLVDTDVQYIHVKVTCLLTKNEAMMSFVYGLHDIPSRRPLWNNLKDFSTSIFVLSLIMGDINNILSSADKCDGAAVKPSETCDFTDCVTQLELADLQNVGCLFTWSNTFVILFEQRLTGSWSILNGYNRIWTLLLNSSSRMYF